MRLVARRHGCVLRLLAAVPYVWMVAMGRLDLLQRHGFDGFYDVQQPGVLPEHNLRGLFTADEHGRYWFRSIVPCHYPIPVDGPVGELLGSTGRHPYRPAHLHFLVSAPGYRPVTTHAFIADSPYLDSDAVFGVKESLVREVVDGVLTFDVTLVHADWADVMPGSEPRPPAP